MIINIPWKFIRRERAFKLNAQHEHAVSGITIHAT